MLWLIVLVAIVLSLARTRRNRGVAFLHPNSGGGGGGERVLWIAIRALLNEGKMKKVALYSARFAPHSGASKVECDGHLLKTVMKQFQISIAPSQIDIIYIDRTVPWTNPARYPFLTLFLQTFCGGIAAFIDVASNGSHDVVIETVGIPFFYPLARIVCGTTICCYTHYPVISTDMLQRVGGGQAAYNNRGVIARSKVLSFAKSLYYRLFAWFYFLAGGMWASLCMTNSRWTDNHIRSVWHTSRSQLLYPPVNVNDLIQIPLKPRKNTIVSIGQFRPEKDHEFQVRCFALAAKRLPEDVRLLLIGGVRNEGDAARVEGARSAARTLGVQDRVEFIVNAPFDRLRSELASGAVGLHCMVDEHFGICVVEYQAAGCVAVAHRSGGPKADIVQDRETGFLCRTEEEYADCLVEAFRMRDQEKDKWYQIAQQGRDSSKRFTDETFSAKFADLIGGL